MKKLTLKNIQDKIVLHQKMVMLSFLFGIVGFIYNTWRYEHSEYNNNVRTASFQMLKELSKFEQNIYANHYDKDNKKGNPRDGWITIGLINDLSPFVSLKCQKEAKKLKVFWKNNWNYIRNDEMRTNQLLSKVENVREASREVLHNLF